MARLTPLLLLLASAALVSATPQAADAQAPTNGQPTPPIPPTEWATSYPGSLTRQDADTEIQVKNTLAHYPLALDGKNFAALDQIFTTDAVANYSAPLGVVTPLAKIKEVVE